MWITDLTPGVELSYPDKCVETYAQYSGQKNQGIIPGRLWKIHTRSMSYPQVIHKMWKTYVNYVERGGYDFLEKTGGFA